MAIEKFTIRTKITVIDCVRNVYRMMHYDKVLWYNIDKHFWLQPPDQQIAMYVMHASVSLKNYVPSDSKIYNHFTHFM